MVYVHEGGGVYVCVYVYVRCVGVCMCTKYILVGTTSVEM